LPAHLKKIDADILFDGPPDTERWDVRLRHKQIKVASFLYEAAPEEQGGRTRPAEAADRLGGGSSQQERYVILAIRRGEKLIPMSMRFKWKPGDIAAVAIYEPEFDAVVGEMTDRGWVFPAAVSLPAATGGEAK